MRILCQIVALMLSVTGTIMAQQSAPHLLIPGHKRTFQGLSHIEVDLGQRNTLLIGFDRFAQVRTRQNVDSVLRLFMADYRKVADTTRSPTATTHALFRLGDTDRALDLRFVDQSTASFRFRNQRPPLQVKTRQDTVQIVWASDLRGDTKNGKSDLPEQFSLYLFVNSLDDIDDFLKAGGVNGNLQRAFESVRQYKGHDLTDQKMAFDMIQGADQQAKFIGPGLARAPFVSLQPGIGVGLIRNQWVPSLILDVQFIPNRRRGVAYGVGYVSNFFFSQSPGDGQFQAFRNDFLTVGVAFYNSEKNDKSAPFSRQLAAFNVGFPVYRRGAYFDRDAIRLSGTAYQKGLFKVQPELYMNGFFRKVYPGLKVVVGL